MSVRVRLVLFDVNETLSNLSPLRDRFEEIGVPGHLMTTWFTGVLRDGFALTAAGAYADLADVADAGLRGLLAGLEGWTGDEAEAASRVMTAFGELNVNDDVPDGVRALRAAGIRLATLTNGSAACTEGLLARAGLVEEFEMLLDVHAPRAWKPAADAYRYAVDRVGVSAEETALVAVHPWDIDGARRVGLQAVWLRRQPGDFPRVMIPPTHIVTDLRELAPALAKW